MPLWSPHGITCHQNRARRPQYEIRTSRRIEVIDKKIEAYEKQFSALFEEFIKPIRKSLSENHYEYTITARTKSVYSVWLKMQRRNISFDEIYDLLAVRIVFKPKADQPEKWQCWNIYSLITDIYSPKPERIRDWVSVPKANGYEALHLTVMGPEGQWFEVQIRSERMDEIAEKGLAAHWKYKNEAKVRSWINGWRELRRFSISRMPVRWSSSTNLN